MATPMPCEEVCHPATVAPVQMHGRYALVTPARNEGRFIGRTIASVVGQTVRPVEWIIVSDGSTDDTDDLVREAATMFDWIRLIALPPRPQRTFDGVVRNSEMGVRALTTPDYEYVGLLDADVELQPDYFAELLTRFQHDSQLGLAGGVVVDPGTSPTKLPRNQDDVPGAVAFFSRRCFEALGGLVAPPEGGWDCLACLAARMHGFRTQLMTDLIVEHLKPRSVMQGGLWRRHFQAGQRDFAIGYAAPFTLVKCLSRIPDAPRLLGAVAHWFGYCEGSFRRRTRVVPPKMLSYLRAEQYSRLRSELGRFLAPIVGSR